MRSMTLLAASAIWAACHASLAADTPRQVFAHYMVCIPTYGGDSSVSDFQREIRDAKAAGIDGFALNCGGWTLREPHYKRRVLLVYRAAQELETGFKLFLSADYATGLTSEETRDMVESFRTHPNQLRHEGKPVLSTFGGGTAQTDFIRNEFTGNRAIVYVPFYYPRPAAEMPNQAQAEQVFRDHPTLDGFFHFGAAGTPRQIAESNRLLGQTWLGAGKLFMAGITPCYRGLGGNYRVYETDGFEGYARQWEGAIRDRATWVEIVTWNDWGEASYVAPFGAPAATLHWSGHWGPMLSHAAFLGVGRYYIDWFKQGTPPAIREDALFYAYRTHLKCVPGLRNPKSKDGETAFPGGTATLIDRVHATLFLTAPASLIVHSGDTSKRFDLDAGVSHVALPLAPGPQRFVLTRGPATVIDKTGEHPVSATDAWGNYNLFAGEAHPLPASSAAGGGPASQTPGSARLP